VKQLNAKSHQHPPPENNQAMPRHINTNIKTTCNGKKATPPQHGAKNFRSRKVTP
jgi:hypothetical protein